jgi:hypothetical protein
MGCRTFTSREGALAQGIALACESHGIETAIQKCFSRLFGCAPFPFDKRISCDIRAVIFGAPIFDEKGTCT